MRQPMDDRAEPRDEVYHRTRLTGSDGRAIDVVVVNLSPHGFMARTDANLAAGERVEIMLPVVDRIGATLRWVLGGRVGGQFEQAIDPRRYRALLTAAGG